MLKKTRTHIKKGKTTHLTVTCPVVILFTLLSLSSCGGGGDDGHSPPPPASGSSQVAIQNLGTYTLPTNGSLDLQAQVDAAASFVLIADGGSTAADIDIDSVVDPVDRVFVTPDFNDLDPIGKNGLQAAGDTLATGIFPHTPQYTVPSGTYTFRVRSFDAPSNNLRVLALVNHRVNPTGGTLDVNLIFCGIRDLNRSNALSNPKFQVILDESKRIYALAGIQMLVASLLDCDQSDQARLSILTGETEFRDLLSTSRGINNQALNFFFVQDFDTGALGRAGKIMGPPLIQGTRYSGVVVTTMGGPIGDMTQPELLLQGATIAHEGGHYLGLYHPTEREGDDFDPIDDTPQCLRTNDVSGNGQVSASECLNFGGTNLMFWTAGQGIVQEELTAGQKFVLHRSPYLH